ncbi:unnamed protein product, partial [Amoebophrya sp. A120]|eukprot:GSA120T00023264001.1
MGAAPLSILWRVRRCPAPQAPATSTPLSVVASYGPADLRLTCAALQTPRRHCAHEAR